jgi:DNA-binding beta-propeller fold protein YncE
MPARLASLLIATTALLAALCSTASAADRVYWTNFSGNSIAFANLDGTGGGGTLNTTGATAPSQPTGIAIDPAAGRIYWASANGGKVSYANLDNTGGGNDLSTAGANVSGLRGLAIDPAGGRIYWAATAGGTISYANLDGSGGNNLSTTGATLSNPNGVAIDPAANRIYWANRNVTTGNKISYANLDGTGSGNDLPTGAATVSGPAGIAVDPAAGRAYWANQVLSTDSQKVAHANLDGSGGANLNTAGSCAVCSPPTGLALDPDANRAYWTNSFTTPLSFANLDGTGSGGDLNTTGAPMADPAYLAILRAPVPTGAPTVGGTSVTGAALACSQGSWAGNRLGAHLYRAPRSFEFQWTLNGAEIAGATSSTHVAAAPGAYGCKVSATNAAGSAGPQTSAPHTVSAPAPPQAAPPSSTPAKRKCKKGKKKGKRAKKNCKRKK